MSSTQTRQIADRYKLVRPLGRGGMGLVWLAEDTLLTRPVAVKEIEFPPQLDTAAGQAVKNRAIREARSAARLNHAGVVTIFDVMQEEHGAFIVMEYIDSPTLGDRVKRDGPLSPERSARIGLQLLEALEAAHRSGVVHRDIKPGNIMITAQDHVKLADFGIASVKDDPKITSTGTVLGSPQFMAPEQASGSGSDDKTDFWALGATLYYTVEGTLPFDRGRPIPTLAAVVHDDPRPMQRAGALEPVILKLLSKEPGERPRGAELKAMLERVARTAPLSAIGPSGEQEARTQPLPERSQPGPTPPKSGAGARAILGVLSALVAIGLIVVAVALALGGGDSPSERARPPDSARSPAGDGSGRRGAASAPRNKSTPGEPKEAAPAGWETYRDAVTGYTLRYPPGWDVSRGGSLTDFRDPETGTYLRVDWTDAPGRSAEEAWRELARSFAARHSNYSEIRITPMTYKGFDAAIWEFTYTDGGANLHAADLGFVTGDYGFALFFQTHAENWDSSQQLFNRLQASFRPPS